jgi:hypothetical protein
MKIIVSKCRNIIFATEPIWQSAGIMQDNNETIFNTFFTSDFLFYVTIVYVSVRTAIILCLKIYLT